MISGKEFHSRQRVGGEAGVARLADAVGRKAKATPLGEAGLSMKTQAGRGTAGFLTLSIGDEEDSTDNCRASVPDQAASEMEARIA